MTLSNPFRAAGTFTGLSYVERSSDEQLYNAVIANIRYPYLLAPRQSGKSSMMAMLIRRLAQVPGIRCAFLDLSSLSPDELSSYTAFVKAICAELAGTLDLPETIPDRPNFLRIMRTAARASRDRIVILIDEVDVLSTLQFKDTFLSQIRALYNERAYHPAACQIQFILAGVAQAADLVTDPNRSPFNIGQEILLEDLSPAQLDSMIAPFRAANRVTSDLDGAAVHQFTEGAVYLTQLVLERLWDLGGDFPASQLGIRDLETTVEMIIRQASNSVHFLNIYAKFQGDNALLEAFRKWVETGNVDGKALLAIKLTGITNGLRPFRNRIYERVFGSSESALRLVSLKTVMLPPRSPYFTGRARELEVLHHTLSHTTVAYSMPVAISGLGGIGKTQLAIEYAWSRSSQYEHIFFVRAASVSDLEAGFREVAQVLDLPERGARKLGVTTKAVKRWFETHDGWLLILDNADDPSSIRTLLPVSGSGHLLLTTRARALHGMAKTVPLDELPVKDAVALLQARAERAKLNPAERKAAEALAKELGGLPLALDLAGAYIAHQQVRYGDYLRGYERHRLALLEKGRPLTGDYPASVSTTWKESFHVVEAESVAAAEVLRLSAFLDGNAIPLELLVSGAVRLGNEVASTLSGAAEDPIRVDELLEPLSRYSLIRRDVEGRTFQVHRLVQEVVRAGLDEEGRRVRANRVIMALDLVFPTGEFTTWSQCERLIDQVRAARIWIEALGLEGIEAARVLNRAGTYLDARGRYGEAEPLYRRSLMILEKALGQDHPAVALNLNNLAALLRAMGRYEEAEPLYRRSLMIYEETLGPEHPDVALSLNNMAALLDSEGRYPEAEPLYRRSLAIREKILGVEHPDVAGSLSNLAALLRAQGRYSEAEPLYRRSLAIRKTTLGPDYPDIAISLNNLAVLLRVQGRYNESEPLYRQALAIWERALGPDHPDVATSLNNLALLLREQGSHGEAESLYRSSLAIRERTLGPDHPDVAQSLNNLALLLDSAGNAAEAEPLLRRAVEISRRALPGHPDLAIVLRNHSRLLRSLGRSDESAAIGGIPSAPSAPDPELNE